MTKKKKSEDVTVDKSQNVHWTRERADIQDENKNISSIWHLGQFGTYDNLASMAIWHLGQFGTAHVGGTIWYRSVKEDNLAPQCKRGQIVTTL